MARPVTYQDSPPLLANPQEWVNSMFGEKDKDDLFTELLYLKQEKWAYQKEWRIVSRGTRVNESGLFSDYSFNSSELTGIYFGPQCPVEVKEDIQSMLIGSFEHVFTCATEVNLSNSGFNFILC